MPMLDRTEPIFERLEYEAFVGEVGGLHGHLCKHPFHEPEFRGGVDNGSYRHDRVGRSAFGRRR